MNGRREGPGGTLLVRLLNSDGFKRVARTFLFAFLGLLLPGVLGWLADLTAWAQTEGQTPFPDATSLVYLGVAAIGAGSIAVVNAVAVIVEELSGHALGRTVTPRPPTGEAGEVGTRTLAFFVVVGATVLLIVMLL